MKSLIITFGALFLVMNASYANCAQEPSTKAPKSESEKNKKNSERAVTLNTDKMSKTLDDDTKNKCTDCSSLYENGWENVLFDPTAIFTFLIAAFTLLLFLENIRANKRRLRAYVFPENAGIWEGSILEPPQPGRAKIPGVMMIFKNSGQTPAYRVVSWVQIAVIEPINEHTLVVPALEDKYSNTLGSNSTFSKAIWYHRALTVNEIQDIVSGARAIYLYGRVEYRDVFQRKLHSNFRLHYTGAFPPLKGAIFHFSEKGNDAR